MSDCEALQYLLQWHLSLNGSRPELIAYRGTKNSAMFAHQTLPSPLHTNPCEAKVSIPSD